MTRPRARILLVAWLHLAALWALAVAQPLLDLLGDTPEFFVARGNTRGDILLVAFGLTLVPPTAMAAAELAVSRWPRVRRALHLGLVALLAATIALQVVKDVAGSAVSIGLALALGAATSLAYARVDAVRTFVTVLSPAPALFVAYFLLISPVSELVLPQGTAVAGSAGGSGSPVVMLVLDELSGESLLNRDGGIDAVRYPGFAALARGSTWYRNATSVDYATERALPAVMTGTQPAGDSLPIASDHPRNLFTMLGRSYRFRVQEPATELCPESLCGERTRKETGDRLRSLAQDLRIVGLHLLLPEDLEDDLPSVDNTFEGFGGSGGRPEGSARTRSGIPQSAFEDRGAQFERFVSGIGAGRGPTLDFLHLALPHWPWQLLPSGRQYPTDITRIPGIEGRDWGHNRFLASQGHQRYLLQLGYVDRLVGQLVTRLRRQGLWSRALVVVTADHGVSFRTGQPRRLATHENFPDIASVPMFIKAPGQDEGRVDDSPVRTIDVLPTIADILDLRSGWRFDGRSARNGITGRSTVGVMTGELVSSGFEEFQRARDAAVRRRKRLFGSGETGAGLYRLGVSPGLVGRRPAALPTASGQGLHAELDDLELLRAVDLRSPLIPAFVRGRLTGGSVGTPIAIALNGHIEAVVPAYRDGGELRFGALLPPRSFRQGRNDVRVYEVASGGRALAPIAQAGVRAGPTGRLEGVGADSRIEAGGRALEVDPEAVTGFVENATAPDPGHVSLVGWAADPRGKARVDRVLVFADGRLLVSLRPEVPRLEIVERYGLPTLFSGYRVTTVLIDAGEVVDDPGRLRVFAVLDGRASELRRLGAGRQDQG